ncbi:MAG: hypothetical protein AUJ12_09315 [Alphaproteobacteria bacterium CG1_02_46_17]|nr:MAG: hypothetical protein AUJ12_09315 [Alphaproteobacteria bacterium CG1_02_46_17]
MTIELVIFDNDGTLSDSEAINNAAVSDLLIELGLEKYTLEHCHEHLAGQAMSDLVKLIERENNVTLPVDFIDQFINLARSETERSLRPVPGAVEAVQELERHYKVCVGSNGERVNVMTAIKKIGLLDLFTEDHIFTKSQVARGKPEPDLFLYAAEQMGVSPEKTIVVEDTTSGARAGVSAGMRVLGITAVSHNPASMTKNLESVGVERVFGEWSEIVDYIKKACG